MSQDSLNLAGNQPCQRMLSKHGSNFPNPERIVFTENVVKINRKGKQQDRALLITDKAMYNLLPTDYSKCKRRIDLNVVASVTMSTTSNEFAVHVPEEYDYRFISPNKETIATILRDLILAKKGVRLGVQRVVDESLLQYCVTKDVARVQTREERLQRYRELLNQEADSDEEDRQPRQTMVLEEAKVDQPASISPDDFEFLKVLGRGAFGKVMQVRNKNSGDLFAMKILKKSAIVARNQVEHTRAERQILQSLNHPFLMRLRFAFQTEVKLYLVLDFKKGGELFFHLKKKRRFSEAESRIFVGEVGMALGHLHSLGVIYRDLKPENILLDVDGHVCLTDFGLSKELEQDDQTHTFCGTPEYLAPEIIMKLGHDKEVDWWSLGILAYELSVGIPPFYSQNVNEMYRKIQSAPLLFPPHLSANCKELISSFLQREPAERLGAGARDFEAVKSHAWFETIDWDRLYRKEIDPPYKPRVKSSATDTSQFDREFTNQPAIDSFDPRAGHLDGAQFSGFTYAGNDGGALS